MKLEFLIDRDHGEYNTERSYVERACSPVVWDSELRRVPAARPAQDKMAISESFCPGTPSWGWYGENTLCLSVFLSIVIARKDASSSDGRVAAEGGSVIPI